MNQDQWPANVFLIGAQKAGTTALAAALAAHPEIVVSTPKEPQFFTQNWERGTDWYRGCFPRVLPKIVIDASTSYSMAPVVQDRHDEVQSESRMSSVPERIRRGRPDARFVYVLRDPVDRAISAYWHAVRAGEERREPRDAFGPGSMYVRASLYTRQLAHFMSQFERSSFRLIDYDALKKDPVGTQANILEFLGLSPLCSPTLAAPKNPTYVYTRLGRLVQPVLKKGSPLRPLLYRVREVLPRRLSEQIERKIAKRPPDLSSRVRETLRHLLEEEYQGESLYNLVRRGAPSPVQ
jgi:hypothetical protein